MSSQEKRRDENTPGQGRGEQGLRFTDRDRSGGQKSQTGGTGSGRGGNSDSGRGKTQR